MKKFVIGLIISAVTLSLAPSANAAMRTPAGEVILDNRSGELIDRAIVSVSRQTFEFSALKNGQTRRIRFNTGPDSDYGVSITFHSGRKIFNHTGYITSGVKYRDKIIVGNDKIILESGDTISK